MAYMPELGSLLFCADGETAGGALQKLNIIKETLFKQWIIENYTPPKPGEITLKVEINKEGIYEVWGCPNEK